MFNVVLYQPEIPPNTGNIIRLCANTGCNLHLIKPMGFNLDDKRLRRAGLDYREFVDIREWDNLQLMLDKIGSDRIFAATTKGQKNYTDTNFERGDVLMFGPETRGLPKTILDSLSTYRKLRIPMKKNSRSLNLANAVSIIVYEAWRQLSFR
ncbi:MAG: tRNA (uridine(34)/cytosine(34)/5-carboxymethylaminomethyluridine(34)-2'-O)-methyltransferase TrmL [Gammaproteobacteria bacterium]|nr:tRNA (uridine(34)/cytosine(34)/5-carboxymethylaminomethyluridine(34)-2'-O)-methyltransferase TrmL [Gammaproteobacteria bacterium]|tara:strand:- start:86 stop:541 length:456 start_codon:yes stop_codon:yes gene_type:complete